MTHDVQIRTASRLLRFALAASFLSAVADRFGGWGAPGTAYVAWGDWAHFLTYVVSLTPYASGPVAQALAVIATLLEVALSVLLLIGTQLRIVALLSALLLLSFALSMAVFTSIKAPLDFSVFTAAAGALLLSALEGRAAARGEA